jgi:nuclear transcription factor Y gamma
LAESKRDKVKRAVSNIISNSINIRYSSIKFSYSTVNISKIQPKDTWVLDTINYLKKMNSSNNNMPPFRGPAKIGTRLPLPLEKRISELWTIITQEQNNLGPNEDYKTHSDLPLARVKKIMKTDPDVRMVSQEAPMVFARACHLFIMDLTLRAWMESEQRPGAPKHTLLRCDVDESIFKCDQFDFLVDVANGIVREELPEPKKRKNKRLAAENAAREKKNNNKKSTKSSSNNNNNANNGEDDDDDDNMEENMLDMDLSGELNTSAASASSAPPPPPPSLHGNHHHHHHNQFQGGFVLGNTTNNNGSDFLSSATTSIQQQQQPSKNSKRLKQQAS